MENMNYQTKPCLCAALRKATRVITKRYEASLKPSGLKVTQYSMLINISRLMGITISELAKVMVMDQSTVTRNIQLLEKKGYVYFKEEGTDLRVKLIHISESGKQVLDQAKPLWKKAQRETENQLGTLGFDVMVRALNSVVS